MAITSFLLPLVFLANEVILNTVLYLCHFLLLVFRRAPELLYGSRTYTEGVDLWSVGCIFGEMINRSPIFPGENDIDQLGIVIRALGTPNNDIWPGVSGEFFKTTIKASERYFSKGPTDLPKVIFTILWSPLLMSIY